MKTNTQSLAVLSEPGEARQKEHEVYEPFSRWTKMNSQKKERLFQFLDGASWASIAIFAIMFLMTRETPTTEDFHRTFPYINERIFLLTGLISGFFTFLGIVWLLIRRRFKNL